MIEPRPSSLRLFTRASEFALPKPPFGLPGWREDGDALAILIDEGDLASVAGVANQLPPAATLPPGTTVVVLGAAATSRGFWRRIFGGRAVPLPRALRCTALVARGYVDVGAGLDAPSRADLAWGRSPGRE